MCKHMLIPPTNNPAQSRPSRSPIKVPAVDAERQRPPLERLRERNPPYKENNDLRDERRRRRRASKAAARKAIRTVTDPGGLPKYRVAWCGHRVVKDEWGEKHVHLMREKGRAFYRGLYRCGDVWLCPDCSAKIAAGRRDELAKATIEASRQGMSGCLITYTFPHTRADVLRDMLTQFAKARAKLRGCRPWRRFTSRWKITGEVKALEVTHGANGWHPHGHVATFIDGQVPEERRALFQDELFEAWRTACIRADLPAPSVEHGLHVLWFEDAADMATDYVAKWSSIQELTGAQSKEGRVAGRNPWQLLADYAGGDEEAGRLWLEFSAAFHGRQQLRWSKGLRDRLKAPELFEERLLEEGTSEAQEVVQLTADQWVVVCRTRAQDWVLEIAEQEGSEGVRGAINSLLETVPMPGGAYAALLE